MCDRRSGVSYGTNHWSMVSASMTPSSVIHSLTTSFRMPILLLRTENSLAICKWIEYTHPGANSQAPAAKNDRSKSVYKAQATAAVRLPDQHSPGNIRRYLVAAHHP